MTIRSRIAFDNGINMYIVEDVTGVHCTVYVESLNAWNALDVILAQLFRFFRGARLNF